MRDNLRSLKGAKRRKDFVSLAYGTLVFWKGRAVVLRFVQPRFLLVVPLFNRELPAAIGFRWPGMKRY